MHAEWLFLFISMQSRYSYVPVARRIRAGAAGGGAEGRHARTCMNRLHSPSLSNGKLPFSGEKVIFCRYCVRGHRSRTWGPHLRPLAANEGRHSGLLEPAALMSQRRPYALPWGAIAKEGMLMLCCAGFVAYTLRWYAWVEAEPLVTMTAALYLGARALLLGLSQVWRLAKHHEFQGARCLG